MLHPEALAKRFRERDIAVMTSGKPTEDEGEVPEPSGMRTYLTVKFPLRDEDGSVNGVCGIATDITERKKLQQEMERMAQTDLLTNLPNRRHFMSMAELEVSRTVRYGGELSVLMLDIDHFKNINDTYGHKAGDTVLEKIGALCKQALRDVDIVGRIGGEEFAFLLPQTDREHAVQVAERLRNTIAEAEIAIEGEQSLPVTVSIGVSAYAGTATNIAVLLNQADQLLYEAKRSGRNRVCADERC
jgi:diguanylate cyclase (GGDEF)-like protein